MANKLVKMCAHCADQVGAQAVILNILKGTSHLQQGLRFVDEKDFVKVIQVFKNAPEEYDDLLVTLAEKIGMTENVKKAIDEVVKEI